MLDLMGQARRAILEGRYEKFYEDWMNSPADPTHPLTIPHPCLGVLRASVRLDVGRVSAFGLRMGGGISRHVQLPLRFLSFCKNKVYTRVSDGNNFPQSVKKCHNTKLPVRNWHRCIFVLLKRAERVGGSACQGLLQLARQRCSAGSFACGQCLFVVSIFAVQVHEKAEADS